MNGYQSQMVPYDHEVDPQYCILELEHKCRNLEQTNQNFIYRIEELEEQLQHSSKIVNSAEHVTEFVEELETISELLTEYRSSLTSYQEMIKQDAVAQSNKNHALRLRIHELERMVQHFTKENQEIRRFCEAEASQQHEPSQTSRTINNRSMVDHNDVDKKSSVSGRNYPSLDDPNLMAHINLELESIIDKLILELDTERKSKSKYTEQAHKLQKELLQADKELTAKNNRIYQLEMDAFRRSKASNGSGSSHITKTAESPRAKSDRKVFLSLQQVIGTNIGIQERRRIAVKLIKLFERKLKVKNFGLLEPLCITVTSTQDSQELSLFATNNNAEGTLKQLLENLALLLKFVFGKHLKEPEHNYLQQTLEEASYRSKTNVNSFEAEDFVVLLMRSVSGQ